MPILSIDGDVVFAGYGVVDPASGRDDYKGLNVAGKIVAVLYGGPPTGLQSEVRAQLWQPHDKGAGGAGARRKGHPLYRIDRAQSCFPLLNGWPERGRDKAMTWAGSDGAANAPGVPQIGYLSQGGAAKLFAGSRLGWAAVLAADAGGKPVLTGDLGRAHRGASGVDGRADRQQQRRRRPARQRSRAEGAICRALGASRSHRYFDG